MKTCSYCEVNKSLEDFKLRKRKLKDGTLNISYVAMCKECTYKKTREWKANNKEKLADYRKDYYETNKERELENMRVWKEDNKDYILEYASSYNRGHRAERTALQNKRHARKKSASLMDGDEWNDFFIEEIYKTRQLRSEEINIPLDVDHIVPLQGKLVSGLHVWYNLQLLPSSVNRSKNNSF